MGLCPSKTNETVGTRSWHSELPGPRTQSPFIRESPSIKRRVSISSCAHHLNSTDDSVPSCRFDLRSPKFNTQPFYVLDRTTNAGERLSVRRAHYKLEWKQGRGCTHVVGDEVI